MNGFGFGFAIGVLTMAVGIIIYHLLHIGKRESSSQMPTQDERLKEVLREEIHSESDAALAERILRSLSKSNSGRGS